MVDKVLITGATGLVGSYLTRLLVKKGYDVRAIRRPSSRLDLVKDVAEKIEWIEADVLDILSLEDAFMGIEKVFHCAAVVSFDPKMIEKMHCVNVEGTANVVNLSLDFGVKKLIHVSSVAAIGRTMGRSEINENTKWERSSANSNYAISKYQSEQEVWRGVAEGLNAAIVNPSIILGAGDWSNGSIRFFKQVFEGLKFCPPGRSGFVDVRDVAEFLILLMESEIHSERFVLNSENAFYQSFFNKIADNLNKKGPTIMVNKPMAEAAWMLGWLFSKFTGEPPMVTRETARNAMQSWIYENEKSLAAFSHFKYRSFDATISEVSEAFFAASKTDFQPSFLPI